MVAATRVAKGKGCCGKLPRGLNRGKTVMAAAAGRKNGGAGTKRRQQAGVRTDRGGGDGRLWVEHVQTARLLLRREQWAYLLEIW